MPYILICKKCGKREPVGDFIPFMDIELCKNCREIESEERLYNCAIQEAMEQMFQITPPGIKDSNRCSNCIHSYLESIESLLGNDYTIYLCNLYDMPYSFKDGNGICNSYNKNTEDN